MARPQQETLYFDTFDEFLEWKRFQQGRHELVDGVPVAMTGALEGHNVIQGNVFAALSAKLRGGPCRPFTSGMAMKTGLRNGRFPDVTVDCGPRNRTNRSALELHGLDGIIELPAIGTVLTVAEIYEGLDFDAPIDPDAPPATPSVYAS